jgi:hypothetical protein
MIAFVTSRGLGGCGDQKVSDTAHSAGNDNNTRMGGFGSGGHLVSNDGRHLPEGIDAADGSAAKFHNNHEMLCSFIKEK